MSPAQGTTQRRVPWHMPAHVHTHKTRSVPDGCLRTAQPPTVTSHASGTSPTPASCQLSVRLPLRASQVAEKTDCCVSLLPPSLGYAITQTHRHTDPHTHTHTQLFQNPATQSVHFYLGKTLKSQRKHDPSRGFSLSKTCCVFHTYAFFSTRLAMRAERCVFQVPQNTRPLASAATKF